MSEDEKDDPKGNQERPQYPNGFEHVGEAVGKAKGEVKAMEDKLQSLPEDRNLAPRLRPDGEVPFQYSRVPKTVQTERLTAKIEQTKQEAMGQADKMLKKATPEQRKQVRALVLEELYPNPTRTMKAGEKDKIAGEEKETELAQDHMDTQMHDLKADSPEAGKATEDAKSWRELADDRIGRFLSFNRNGKDAARGRSKEADKERDD